MNIETFKSVVIETLAKLDIEEKHLHFSESGSGYYANYRPKHPGYSSADFVVFMATDGSVRITGNTGALVPTIRPFMSLKEFRDDLLREKEIEELAAEINGSLNCCYQPDDAYIILASDLYKAGYRKVKEARK